MHDEASSLVQPRGGEALDQAIQEIPGDTLYPPEAIYKIVTGLVTNKEIAMHTAGQSNGVHEVVLWESANNPNHEWAFYKVWYGLFPCYLVVNQYNKTTMGEATNDSVISSAITKRPAQLWSLRDAGMQGKNRLYYFLNLYNTVNPLVMDVNGSNTSNNTNIIDYPFGGSTNQKFWLSGMRGLPPGDRP